MSAQDAVGRVSTTAGCSRHPGQCWLGAGQRYNKKVEMRVLNLCEKEFYLQIRPDWIYTA